MTRSRHLRYDQSQKKKLVNRKYNRTSRVRPVESADDRSESRSQHCPCCNKRSNNCSADFTKVKQYADLKAISACSRAVYNSCLMNVGDTPDCSEWIKKLKEQKNIWTWKWCWQATSLIRYFNNPELTDIMWEKKLLRPECEPKWQSIQDIITARYAGTPRQKVFGGYYDAPVMTHFSRTADISLLIGQKPSSCQALPATGESWISVSGMPSAQRDVFAARLIWKSVPTAELNKYAASPSRAAFTALYNKFTENIGSVVKGAMGPYQTKCTVEPMVMAKWISQGHLAVWPLKCPGYMKGYKKFFPNLPAKLRLPALYFFHKRMKMKLPHMCFPETISHMCWDARRSAGALDDSLPGFIRARKKEPNQKFVPKGSRKRKRHK